MSLFSKILSKLGIGEAHADTPPQRPPPVRPIPPHPPATRPQPVAPLP